MLSFSPQQDQYLQLAQTRAYYQGLRAGIEQYAHWKDGLQYVGTTGQTLKQALADVHEQEKSLLEKYGV